MLVRNLYVPSGSGLIKSYIGRWLKALAPRNTHIEASAARVQSSIIAIRRLGEELVAKNVDIIKGGNEGIVCSSGSLVDGLLNTNMLTVIKIWTENS